MRCALGSPATRQRTSFLLWDLDSMSLSHRPLQVINSGYGVDETQTEIMLSAGSVPGRVPKAAAPVPLFLHRKTCSRSHPSRTRLRRVFVLTGTKLDCMQEAGCPRQSIYWVVLSGVQVHILPDASIAPPTSGCAALRLAIPQRRLCTQDIMMRACFFCGSQARQRNAMADQCCHRLLLPRSSNAGHSPGVVCCHRRQLGADILPSVHEAGAPPHRPLPCATDARGLARRGSPREGRSLGVSHTDRAPSRAPGLSQPGGPARQNDLRRQEGLAAGGRGPVRLLPAAAFALQSASGEGGACGCRAGAREAQRREGAGTGVAQPVIGRRRVGARMIDGQGGGVEQQSC